MLAQLILDTVVSGGVAYGLLTLRSRFKSRRTEPDRWGAIPWTYRKAKNGVWGFYCSKCVNIVKNKDQMPHCSCDEYHKDHFHFKCNDCGFKAIMRTADDKD